MKLYLRKQLFRFLPNSHFGYRPFSTVGFVPKSVIVFAASPVQFLCSFSNKSLNLIYSLKMNQVRKQTYGRRKTQYVLIDWSQDLREVKM